MQPFQSRGQRGGRGGYFGGSGGGAANGSAHRDGFNSWSGPGKRSSSSILNLLRFNKVIYLQPDLVDMEETTSRPMAAEVLLIGGNFLNHQPDYLVKKRERLVVISRTMRIINAIPSIRTTLPLELLIKSELAATPFVRHIFELLCQLNSNELRTQCM
jgi:hypothetical protein